ncbi:citrate synthase [Arthrobacter sp. PvP023]|uniref:citryl-CoA lyase n=1 Tax=Micrococcaceae TaxID=1268 RepID=UPI001AE619E7|nr:citryl-CoA lyase [Arthrobacter sp. PvP023]MBP1136557.1 citrate synthase [Arthrobacter sp. PvP023]
MATHTRGGTPIRSDIARATPSTVHVHGLDLIDMLGTVSLGDFAYLELFRRLPDKSESVVFNAIVVALVEHGLTPSALTARLTALGAPESLQGAVAAGLLGLGNTFVGTIEGAARICQTYLPVTGTLDESGIKSLAARIAEDFTREGNPIPGLGHPVHKPVDPRAQKLFAITREQGFDDTPLRLMEELSRLSSESRGRILPVNVTGAIGAIAAVLGLPWDVARGLGVMARSIGLVGHLLEERQQPLAASVWTRAERESSED